MPTKSNFSVFDVPTCIISHRDKLNALRFVYVCAVNEFVNEDVMQLIFINVLPVSCQRAALNSRMMWCFEFPPPIRHWFRERVLWDFVNIFDRASNRLIFVEFKHNRRLG